MEADDANIIHLAEMRAQPEDENILMRFIQEAMTSIRERFGEYMNDDEQEDEDHYASNKLEGKNKLVVYLSMPMNWNAGMRKNVADNMHNYLLNTTLASWYKMKDANSAAGYTEIAAVALQELSNALHSRVRPKRI